MKKVCKKTAETSEQMEQVRLSVAFFIIYRLGIQRHHFLSDMGRNGDGHSLTGLYAVCGLPFV